jgi:hypothetical protein
MLEPLHLGLELHQAPDLGAVGAEVGLDVGGQQPGSSSWSSTRP